MDFGMDVTISLLAVALLLVLLLIIRRASKPQSNPRPAMKRPMHGAGQQSAFHAVSIKVGANACDAAREMEGRRFLSSAAPKIPLPGCDNSKCACRFNHHDDRRAGDDRRDPWAPSLAEQTGTYRQEMRKGSDRRRPK
jgi:hypothetical protein